MEFAIASIRDVTGVNIEMLGLADRDQPGILEYHRKQAGLAILAPLFDSLRRYRKEQGRVLLHFIQTYVSDGRLVRIVGPEGEKYAPLIKTAEAAAYDIIVDEAPTSQNQKDKVFAVLSQLLPILLSAGIPVPPEILDYSPLPESLAQRWKRMLIEPTTAPPPAEPPVAPSSPPIQDQIIRALAAENDALKRRLVDRAAEFEWDAQLRERAQAFDESIAVREMALKEQKAAADVALKAAGNPAERLYAMARRLGYTVKTGGTKTPATASALACVCS